MNFFKKKNFFLIGIAGSGMSAIAQFLRFSGKEVYGSDRLFSIEPNSEIRRYFSSIGIKTYEQGKGQVHKADVVIVSTAIEASVYEYRQAKLYGIPIVHRSEILQDIAENYISVAVAGTSGKSTTTAMLFHILDRLDFKPSLITGSPLLSLQKKGLKGNAFYGKGKILVYEADESDSSIINYKPDVSVVLNIDKDHKEIEQLQSLFKTFFKNTKRFKVKNADDLHSHILFADKTFGMSEKSDIRISDFNSNAFGIAFKLNGTLVRLDTIGFHNAMNSAAAAAVASYFDISMADISASLSDFEGIDRRMHLIGTKNGKYVIDDYAHNPAKIKAAIEAVEGLTEKKVIVFQPHGFMPLKFLFNELVDVFSQSIKPEDILVILPVYYVGGTVRREITSEDLVSILKKKNKNVLFYSKQELYSNIDKLCRGNCTLLIMGARDPYLGEFARSLYEKI